MERTGLSFDGHGINDVDSYGSRIATLSDSYKHTTAGEHYGRLFAAAPDMLEALTAIQARLHGEWDNPALVKFGPLGDSLGDVNAIVRAAIAKAEGK